MIEASGIGWEGRNEQAKLVAKYLHALANNPAKAKVFQEKKKKPTRITGGFNYLKLDRMAFYVHKDSYRKAMADDLKSL
jgi:hypothetical protein